MYETENKILHVVSFCSNLSDDSKFVGLSLSRALLRKQPESVFKSSSHFSGSRMIFQAQLVSLCSGTVTYVVTSHEKLQRTIILMFPSRLTYRTNLPSSVFMDVCAYSEK